MKQNQSIFKRLKKLEFDNNTNRKLFCDDVGGVLPRLNKLESIVRLITAFLVTSLIGNIIIYLMLKE